MREFTQQMGEGAALDHADVYSAGNQYGIDVLRTDRTDRDLPADAYVFDL